MSSCKSTVTFGMFSHDHLFSVLFRFGLINCPFLIFFFCSRSPRKNNNHMVETSPTPGTTTYYTITTIIILPYTLYSHHGLDNSARRKTSTHKLPGLSDTKDPLFSRRTPLSNMCPSRTGRHGLCLPGPTTTIIRTTDLLLIR